MLTDSQKQQWHADGFIKIEQFFNPASLTDMSRDVDEIATWEISENNWMMWFEKTRANQKILSKVENFLDFHPSLNNTVLTDQRIEHCVSQLLDEDVMLLKELLIFKYPDSGGYHPHQDVYSVPHKLPDRQVHAIVMIAIDESVPENGGLYMTRGHHQKGILPMGDDLIMLPEVSQTFEFEPIYCKPGDILIFDNHAPHYSKPNNSDRSRRAMYLVFRRASTIGPTRSEYNIKKRAIAPPEGKDMDLDQLKKINPIHYRDDASS